jgi:hypothetical protein
MPKEKKMQRGYARSQLQAARTQGEGEGDDGQHAAPVAANASSTTHGTALLNSQPTNDASPNHNDAAGSATPTADVEVEIVVRTLEELLQYPDVHNLSTEQIKQVIATNLELRSQIRQELGDREYDRRVKAHNERIVEQGKPSYIFRNYQITKNGLIRAVDKLSKKGSAQYTIEEEYLVVKAVCLLALRKIKGYR